MKVSVILVPSASLDNNALAAQGQRFIVPCPAVYHARSKVTRFRAREGAVQIVAIGKNTAVGTVFIASASRFLPCWANVARGGVNPEADAMNTVPTEIGRASCRERV